MGLKLASGLVYAALAAFAVALVAAPLGDALRALGRPFSYAPDLTWPWLWLSLAASVTLLVGDVARRLAGGGKVGMARYLVLLGLLATSLAARKTVAPPRRPTVEDGLAHAMARVELAADQAFATDHRYPGQAGRLKVELPALVQDLGFFERGAVALPTRVVVRPDALEPVLAPGKARPGDVVFAVDGTFQRYWITAFTLDRRGRVAALTDGAGRVVVVAGAFGHPRSRLDPVFPEYPHKLPLQHGAGP